MSNPERFDFYADGFGCVERHPNSDGEFVLYTDYDALRQQCDELAVALDSIMFEIDDRHPNHDVGGIQKSRALAIARTALAKYRENT